MSARFFLPLVLMSVLLPLAVFAQADIEAPKWFDQDGPNKSAPGQSIILKARWTDNIALDTATLNMLLPNGTQQEFYFDMSGLEDTAAFLYKVPDFSLDSKFIWSITANDTRGNENITNTMEFMLADSGPPKWSNLTQSRDILQVGDTVLLSAHITDDYGLSHAVFYTNETGNFTIRRIYAPKGREADVSFLWVNESLKLGAIVGWYIFFNDTSGNSNQTAIKSFALRACPVCPSDTAWSDCVAPAGERSGIQKQTIYECGAITDYACKEIVKNQTCTIGVKRAEADAALNAAETEIDNAIAENKDVFAAEKLLAQANTAYNKGDWAAALDFASQAKQAAQKAEVKGIPGEKEVPAEKGADILPYLIIVIAIGIVFFYLYKTGRLHLPAAKEVEEEGMEEGIEEGVGEAAEAKPERKTKGMVCGVCGNTFATLYDCEECGTKVCYNDARTYKGKIYCLNDLRKKGLV